MLFTSCGFGVCSSGTSVPSSTSRALLEYFGCTAAASGWPLSEAEGFVDGFEVDLESEVTLDWVWCPGAWAACVWRIWLSGLLIGWRGIWPGPPRVTGRSMVPEMGSMACPWVLLCVCLCCVPYSIRLVHRDPEGYAAGASIQTVLLPEQKSCWGSTRLSDRALLCVAALGGRVFADSTVSAFLV